MGNSNSKQQEKPITVLTSVRRRTTANSFIGAFVVKPMLLYSFQNGRVQLRAVFGSNVEFGFQQISWGRISNTIQFLNYLDLTSKGGISLMLLIRLLRKSGQFTGKNPIPHAYIILRRIYSHRRKIQPIQVNTVVKESKSVSSIAFSPDGKVLAYIYDGNLKLGRLSSDNSSATCVATLKEHIGSVNSVAFHPTAPLLATGSSDRTVKLWRLSSDNSSATCVATLEAHSGSVSSVAFHPTAPLLATGSWDKTAKLWRLSSDNSSATCVATLEGHTDWVNSVAFHPTAPLLATGSFDKTAKLWRLSSDNSSATCVATLEAHTDLVTSVAFHPTAPILATGSWDKTAKLWRVSDDNSSATCVATLEGHTDLVRSVGFHPTAPLLATGSSDNTAKLWH